MRRSFKLHVFLSVTLCVLAFIGASRIVVRWASGEPFQVYFSEVLAQHVQKELDGHVGELDLKVFQSNLEKTVLHLHANEMLVFVGDMKASADTAEFERSLFAQEVKWEVLQTKPFEATTLKWRQKNWRMVRVFLNPSLLNCIQI